MSTALADAKITSAVWSRFLIALLTRSSVGSFRISSVGISTTAAPRSTSSLRNGSTWWRARVMRIRRPCSGRFAMLSRRSDISTPGPSTSSASPRAPYVAALRASSPSGAVTRCWPASAGFRMRSAGVLAPIGECIWVAGKKHCDLAPVARETNYLIDGLERSDVGVRAREMQEAGAAAIVIADDIGLFHRFDRLHGGQAWMAWSNAYEADPAHATIPIPTRDTARD